VNNRRRCVIYTRTSTEEGLGQDFNSLDAQSEACAAYIKSQVGEGWSPFGKAYEDGGYSGGSMARPAFQRLLADIEARKIDVVVVYKVDRLTRSLADFAKIMEALDKAGACFVSVTQSFNTTTSMGRLTLNVLLSFAQFEREVTGERIRDKLAASKAKGMWMGGRLPLGYNPSGRTLVIDEAEAAHVRLIFRRFIELRSVDLLEADLRSHGVVSKRWTSKVGITHGGEPIRRGGLYTVLNNPLYLGVIRHKGNLHPGQHDAIIDQETWDAAQAIFAASGERTSPTIVDDLLKGKLYDDAGHAMVSTTGHKGVRRYRYYASTAALRGRVGHAGSLRRVTTRTLDDAVISSATRMLAAEWASNESEQDRVRAAVQRVELSARSITLDLVTESVDEIGLMAARAMAVERLDKVVRVRLPIALARRRNTMTLIGANGITRAQRDDALVRAITRAKTWVKQLEAGSPRSIIELARSENLCKLHTAKLLPLAFLAPDLVEMILDGRQPARLTLTALIAEPLPETWVEQRARFAEFS